MRLSLTNAATMPLLAVLWLFAAIPRSADGQVIRGRLVDAAGGTGIGSVMVSLVDRSGREIERGLTRSGGAFQLQASAPGEYRIRADRIGFATTFSDIFSVAAGDTLTIELAARIEPVSLKGIEVEADRECRVRPDEGLAVARVWEEARKALAAAVWTQERGLYRYEMLRIKRRLDPRGRRVEREDRDYVEVSAPMPYDSRPADSLLAEGFVRLSRRGSVFWGVDADVLLSDAFLDTHCFRIRRGERQRGELIGLEFEPAPGREVAEIAGTMWLDPVSAQLKRVDFQYVNLDVHPRLLEASPGGKVEFTTLPNGTGIVPSWHLRMFRPGEARDPATGRLTASLQAVIVEHGEVLRVHDEQDIVFEGDEGARIAGTVFDSQQVGLPGARVFLHGEGTEVVTDAEGRFELAHLGPYVYTVHYTHPDLEQLWYRPEPLEVEVGPAPKNPVRVAFEAPSLDEVLEDVCGGARQPEPTLRAGGRLTSYEGILTVAVTDAEGNPAAEATVLIMTGGLRAEDIEEDHAGTRGETDASGLFRKCWLPVDTPLEVVVLNGSEQFDRGAFGAALPLADHFPGRVQEITIAREAPYRTLLLRIETRSLRRVGFRRVSWRTM